MGDSLQNECNVITIFPMVIECIGINPSLPTASDGQMTVSITGGTPPYTIIWSNGNISPAIDNLSVGEYSVTVIDYYGDFSAETSCTLSVEVDCTFSASVTNFITEPTPTPTLTRTVTPTPSQTQQPTPTPTRTPNTTNTPTPTLTLTPTSTIFSTPTPTPTRTNAYNAMLVRNCDDELDMWLIANNGLVNIGDYIKIKLSLNGPARPYCYEVISLTTGWISASVHSVYTDCTCETILT